MEQGVVSRRQKVRVGVKSRDTCNKRGIDPSQMAQIEHTRDRSNQMSSHRHRQQKVTPNRHGAVLVWARPARNAIHFVVAVSAARSSSSPPPHVFVLRLHFHHIKVSC